VKYGTITHMGTTERKIVLNRDSAKTLAVQLADALRSGIVRGDWAVGEALPGIHELAEACNASAKVSRKALAILASEGLTKPVRGVGSETEPRCRDFPRRRASGALRYSAGRP